MNQLIERGTAVILLIIVIIIILFVIFIPYTIAYSDMIDYINQNNKVEFNSEYQKYLKKEIAPLKEDLLKLKNLIQTIDKNNLELKLEIKNLKSNIAEISKLKTNPKTTQKYNSQKNEFDINEWESIRHK